MQSLPSQSTRNLNQCCNPPLIISCVITGLAAGWTGWNKTLKVGENAIPLGKYFIITFIILVVIGFFLPKKSSARG